MEQLEREARGEPADSTLRCPTCRATQAWSDECRRCGSNLTLLRRFSNRGTQLRGQCLRALQSNNVRDAVAHSRALFQLHPTDASRRLLAVCLLTAGEFQEARTHALGSTLVNDSDRAR